MREIDQLRPPNFQHGEQWHTVVDGARSQARHLQLLCGHLQSRFGPLRTIREQIALF